MAPHTTALEDVSRIITMMRISKHLLFPTFLLRIGSTQRTTYKHHHCVLDWLEDNGFGMSGSMNTHPHIFVYPFPNTTSYNSPDDGFIFEITNFQGGLPGNISPLTVHPMKNHIYATPKEANEYVRGLNK